MKYRFLLDRQDAFHYSPTPEKLDDLQPFITTWTSAGGKMPHPPSFRLKIRSCQR
jgi:hypothetical protein